MASISPSLLPRNCRCDERDIYKRQSANCEASRALSNYRTTKTNFKKLELERSAFVARPIGGATTKGRNWCSRFMPDHYSVIPISGDEIVPAKPFDRPTLL